MLMKMVVLLQMYPNHNITNVVEASYLENIPGWPSLDGTALHTHHVRPFRCIGEYFVKSFYGSSQAFKLSDFGWISDWSASAMSQCLFVGWLLNVPGTC